MHQYWWSIRYLWSVQVAPIATVCESAPKFVPTRRDWFGHEGCAPNTRSSCRRRSGRTTRRNDEIRGGCSGRTDIDWGAGGDEPDRACDARGAKFAGSGVMRLPAAHPTSGKETRSGIACQAHQSTREQAPASLPYA
jgi:hypothetical protein